MLVSLVYLRHIRGLLRYGHVFHQSIVHFQQPQNLNLCSQSV